MLVDETQATCAGPDRAAYLAALGWQVADLGGTIEDGGDGTTVRFGPFSGHRQDLAPWSAAHPGPPKGLAEHRLELNRKFRLAFLAGVEEHALRVRGRRLHAAELRSILDRYPGDVPTQGGTDRD